MKILMTGGTGLVGKKVARLLLQKGHHLSILSRQALPPRENVQYHRWDALKKDPLPPQALEGVEAVINLMGENIAGKRWSKRQKKKIEDSRIQATALLAQALKNHLESPLNCFLSVSAVGIYPANSQETLTEDSPPGSGYLSGVCSRWEEEALKVTEANRTVTLRIGVVLAKQGGALAKMLPPFRLGLGGPLGDGKQMMSWIHLNDLSELIVRAVEDANYQGVYNAVSPGVVSNAEFTRTLAKALKRPAFLPLPGSFLKLALGEMSCILLDSQKVIPQRLQKANHPFRYPDLEGALKNILQ